MATATAPRGLRLRSPSPAFSLLDARCGDEDFCLEGAGFEELLRTFGAGLDAPAVGPPAAEAASPAQAHDDLALALVAQLPLSFAAHAPGAGPGLRCLDEAHAGRPAGSCACRAPPAEDEEALYELVGDTGKKNGEKRLRSQISRTPEWRSLEQRERLARVCDAAVPARASLANALRLRHCTLLRKGDLLFLARTWGYQSDIWGHRKDRRGGRGPPLDATSTAVVPHAAAPSLSRLAATQPEAQLAEVRAALAGPLRALAERGIAAFAGFEGVAQRVAQLSRLPDSDAQLRALGPYAQVLVDIGTRRQQGALAEIRRLQAALQAQHADVQLRMLRMDAAQAARPAFLALAAEAEAPWELVFRDLTKLCHSALQSTCSSVVSNLGATVELPAQTEAEAAALNALTAGYDGDGIARGGELSLELLTRAHGMLHTMRLAPLETYFAALSGVLSLLVGHMVGCAEPMSQQCDRCVEARDALTAALAHQ